MSSSKAEQSLTSKDLNNIFFRYLNNDVVGRIANNLSIQDILKLMYASIATYNLFAPSLNLVFAMKARVCVVQGDVDGLVLLGKHKSASLFSRGQVIDPRGRIFYSASAYQLILFLCDKDMKDKIKAHIPFSLKEMRQAQEKEMDIEGGNDLIKLDHDPLAVLAEDFKGITEFKTSYLIFNRIEQVTFPLLQNRDGIISYQNNFYYANQTTKIIKKLGICLSPGDEEAWNGFKGSFVGMENNSGRRSSDAEHQLIAKILKCALHRKGLQYEQNGILYCDSRSPFRLINAYRTCLRLYDEAASNGQVKKAHTSWRNVGIMQGEEMWLLQRICEKDRLFFPMPLNFTDFKREISIFIFNYLTDNEECVFSDGKLAVSLGLEFAIYKGCAWKRQGIGVKEEGRWSWGVGVAGIIIDLIAICRHVENAKVNIIEFEQEPNPQLQANSHTC